MPLASPLPSASVLRADGQTAPGGAAHAVRLADDRPRHRDQPGPRRARPALRGDEGQDPVLAADEARALLDSISTDSLLGLRDRALIGVMIYSFAVSVRS